MYVHIAKVFAINFKNEKGCLLDFNSVGNMKIYGVLALIYILLQAYYHIVHSLHNLSCKPHILIRF